MSEAENFRLNSAVLANRIEEIKRNPPEKILAYKAAHPEYKTVACELLADYAGVSVSTLKNLKLGKMTDCNCYTLWRICRALDVDPAALLGLPSPKVCNPAECSSHAGAHLDAHRQHAAHLESRCTTADQRIADLHDIIAVQRESLGAAVARAECLQNALGEKNAAIAKHDNDIKYRHYVILALVALIAAMAIVFILGK